MALVNKRFVAPEKWGAGLPEQSFFTHLKQLFPLEQYGTFPTVESLNELATSMGFREYQFMIDGDPGMVDVDLYYEQIIHQKRLIPTRAENWHDLFNAFIWLLFPKTKARLNQLHMTEIERSGLHPRTPMRNRVTHFDECGGILVYQEQAHLQSLMEHDWHNAFVTMRERWGQGTEFYIFGHANYEMLLNPYLGLTAKYLPIQVERNFWQKSLAERYAYLDEALLALIAQQSVFSEKGHLKPLPLLGIPGWWPDNSSPKFYQNTDYFRPLPPLKKTSERRG